MIKASHSVSNLHSNLELSPCTTKRTQSSRFVQILDESMCVVRDDLTEWLQRYLFSTANAYPIAAHYLLCRLESGLWLSRLAYKLHYSVLESGFQTALKSKTLSTSSVTHKDNRSYEFLRGAVSSRDLKNLTSLSLPSFPPTLADCAKLPLNPTDLCSFSSETTNYEHNSSCDVDFPKENISLKSHVADRWIARDNISAFIKWCKDLGVPETLLFETNGLINKTEEKNVLLTLMEIARIASRYGLTDLPYLIRMEREIDELEAKHSQDHRNMDHAYHISNEITNGNNKIDNCESVSSNVEMTVNKRKAKVQKSLNFNRIPDGNHKNGNSSDFDTVLIDSQCDSQLIRKNINSCAQTSTNDNQDGSYNCCVSLLKHHSQNDATIMFDNSYPINTNGVYKNHCDSCRNISSQVDNMLNDNEKSPCHHHTLFQTNNCAECSQTLNGSLEGDTGIKKVVVTDPFVQQQLISPYATNRKRHQTLNGDLDLQLPLVEITPVKIISSVINSSSSKCHGLMDIDTPRNCVSPLTVESPVDLRSRLVTSLSISQVKPPKIQLLEILDKNSEPTDVQHCHNSMNAEGTSPPVLCIALTDCLAYDENFHYQLSTDYSSISDDCLIDNQVSRKLAQCTCCNRLCMQRLEEGRYRLGSRIYYLRRFRNHVMVRVGGGWLTLDEFLQRHDPCRRRNHSCGMEQVAASNTVPPIKSCFPVPKPTHRHPEFESPSFPRVNSVDNFSRQWSNGSSSSIESPRSDSSMIDTGIVSDISTAGSVSKASSSLDSIKHKQQKQINDRRCPTIPKAPNLRTASRTRDLSNKNVDSARTVPDTTINPAASRSRASSARRTSVPLNNPGFKTPLHPPSQREGSVSRVSRVRNLSKSRDEFMQTNCRTESLTRRSPWRN
ncbi:Growth arrest-specific protein isoform 4 [Schistosoma japonicum]|uniref:Growth arrest-specific protein isoform 4 n=1 Tax=Schistosoma japonicum TaxID=6182 RepID=A0A4Z2D9E9_SCHJA|nr:Growth arrest-specific protein isoform 4 [Schistosoma japonicum]